MKGDRRIGSEVKVAELEDDKDQQQAQQTAAAHASAGAVAMNARFCLLQQQQ
jgi:hypothetical protein